MSVQIFFYRAPGNFIYRLCGFLSIPSERGTLIGHGVAFKWFILILPTWPSRFVSVTSFDWIESISM